MYRNSITAVVLGAGQDAVHSIKEAQKLGVFVVAMDGNPAAIGLKYANEGMLIDIKDSSAVCQAIKHIQADFVIPVPIGRYLLTTGVVNEQFGYQGVSKNGCIFSTDKFLFHKKLQEKKLRNNKIFLIKEGSLIRKDYSIHYPGIIKPRYGSGSRDIIYLNSAQDLARKANVEPCKEDFILEEVVDGPEYGVDGAVIGGKLQIILLRKKSITKKPVRQAVSSTSIVPGGKNKALYNEVSSYLSSIVSVLEMDNCLINADIIVNNDGLFVIEIAARPSGHYLHDMFVPSCTGIDMASEYIKFQIGMDYTFKPEKTRLQQIRFFDFENCIIEAIPSEEFIRNSGNCRLVRWECKIQQGQYMGPVINGHSIMGRGYFIVEGESEEELKSQTNWILSLFVTHTSQRNKF